MTISKTPYRFKFLDLTTGRIITDNSITRGLTVAELNGIESLCVLGENVVVLRGTGELTADLKDEIFEGDIVEFVVDGEKTTDLVHWEHGGWRLGEYEGSICDYSITKILGTRTELRWPDIGI